MADPFVAEIRIFPFSFAPKGWAFCDGKIMDLSQNTALFSLLGTTYGGNGKSNFALPDLRGNVPVGTGQGAGLSLVDLGERNGEETHRLLESELPLHNHALNAYSGTGNTTTAAGSALATIATGGTKQNSYSGKLYSSAAVGSVTLAPVQLAGGDIAHNNMMPSLVLNYCIALQGVFPPRQ